MRDVAKFIKFSPLVTSPESTRAQTVLVQKFNKI